MNPNKLFKKQILCLQILYNYAYYFNRPKLNKTVLQMIFNVEFELLTKTLLFDNLISESIDEDNSKYYSITSKGVDYYRNNSHKFLDYIKENHLAIIAIIISIIALLFE